MRGEERKSNMGILPMLSTGKMKPGRDGWLSRPRWMGCATFRRTAEPAVPTGFRPRIRSALSSKSLLDPVPFGAEGESGMYHHSRRGAGSSGASKGSPSKHPAVSSKYPTGQPFASLAGPFRSEREKSIRSRPTFSSLVADSASSSSSRCSSSLAITLMDATIAPLPGCSRARSDAPDPLVG